jgi:hypothetical protein
MTLPRSFDASKIKLLGLRASCELLTQSDQKSHHHDQFLDAYCPDNTFQQLTASYLVEPIFNWFRSNEERDPELKERVQGVILKSFGDPRMQAEKNRWPHFFSDKDGSKKRACQDELTRWLTKDTLSLFFKAIEKTAKVRGEDSAALRHWPQRQLFWERYLNQGYIDQAWVVLGRQISQQLDSISSTDGLDIIKYGQFPVGDNAAIIMRVGQSATVVEWSHNGAVWVCPNKHEDVPEMFNTRNYLDKELRAPKDDIEVSRITHDAHHSWKVKLDSAIHNITGIKLRDRYY